MTKQTTIVVIGALRVKVYLFILCNMVYVPGTEKAKKNQPKIAQTHRLRSLLSLFFFLHHHILHHVFCLFQDVIFRRMLVVNSDQNGKQCGSRWDTSNILWLYYRGRQFFKTRSWNISKTGALLRGSYFHVRFISLGCIHSPLELQYHNNHITVMS